MKYFTLAWKVFTAIPLLFRTMQMIAISYRDFRLSRESRKLLTEDRAQHIIEVEKISEQESQSERDKLNHDITG